MTKMISIDSSSTCSGYATWEDAIYKRGGHLVPIEKDKEDRIDEMCRLLGTMLTKEKPDIVVIELTVVDRNAHTQRILSEILGMVRGWCIATGAEFVTYRPTIWRHLAAELDEAVPTKRDECKAWAIKKVSDILGREVQEDEAEAYLIGLARIHDFERNDWELIEEDA